MVDQTTLNGATSQSAASVDSVSGSLADFVGDLADLSELQLQLLRRDARASAEQAAPALVALGLGVCVILSGVAVALGGLALELAALGALSLPGSLATVGLGAVLVGALGSRFALRLVAASTTSFRRSTEELVRNLAWVRTVLARSGRRRPGNS